MTQDIWHHIEYYLSCGISIIPVRVDKEVSNGKTYGPKTPIGRWKEFQENIIVKERLFDIMDRHPNAVGAIVCGRVSGSLELIDIDEKHNPGGSVLYLGELKSLYPELFARLRIHSTPSGGFHILYRCEELLSDGNMKLAVAEGKKEAWIETRGEGGYAVLPPAMGYGIVNNVHIPVVTRSERECMINLARLFDTRKKVEKPFTPTRRDVEFYDENPWDHFNASVEAETILTRYGWQVYSSNSQFIQFTRPDKQTGISASFIRSKRVYYIFTSSTQFDSSTGYMPATVLAMLEFNGDKKRTYHYLVENKYGRVNPKAEQRIVKAAAAKGAPLPANFSPEAQAEYQSEADRLSATYPFGIFWSGDALSGYRISREKVYRIAGALGFAIHGEQICYISGHVVYKVDKRLFFDRVKAYIQEADPQAQIDICDAYEAFLQNAGKFTIERLPLVNPMLFLTSTKHISYKFYRNCYLTITAGGVVSTSYSKIGDRLVWDDQIQPRDFTPSPWTGSLYEQFLDKALVNVEHAHKVIGYLAHEYKDEEMGYIIVLTEVVPNPKDGGGSGKNIFSSLLSHTTTHKDVPGSQVQLNEKFLQAWNGERIFSISDIPKKFDFLFLKNLSTGAGIMKKLWQNESAISANQMPKMVISTNYSFEVTDGGLRRRIIPIEFTDHFTRCGGVKKFFGKMFPYDWDASDWSGYDNLIVHCIASYLASPELSAPELTEGGWIKQFDMNYGENTRLFIEEHFETWKGKIKVTIEEFNAAYKLFCSENAIADKYRLSSIRMNQALGDWCKKHGVVFIANQVNRTNGILTKYKMFGQEAPF